MARRLPALLLLAAASASAAITGSVIDENGKPVAGATVRAFAAEPSAPYRLRMIRREFTRQPLASATTRGDGTFSVEPKQTAVDLMVEADGREMPVVATVDGENVGAIVAARLGPPIRVVAEGKPVADAVVVIGRANALRTDANGAVPNVSPHSAKLILHPDYAPEALGGGETEATLTKGVALQGRVVNAKGPVPHATIMLDYFPFAESGADGTFSSAHAPDEWNEITAFAGDEIGSAAPGAAGSIVVRLGPGVMISGKAVDGVSGAPIAGARMEISRANAFSAGEMVLSDAKGNYAFGPALRKPATVSGRHPRFAIQAGPAAAARDAAVTGRSLARIEGRVVDEKGAPVGGAAIFAPLAREEAITDANGRFSVRVQELGVAVSIHAQKQGYAIGIAPPRLWHFGDEIRDIAIVLPRGFPLTVKVVDARRKPLAGASVTLRRNDVDMFRASAGSDEPGCPTCRVTDPEGAVTFRITEGEYTVTVDDRRGTKPDKSLGRVPLTARSSPLVVEMDDRAPAAVSATPAPKGRIAGRVIDHATGRTVPGFKLAVASPPRINVAQPVPSADGSFTLEGLPAGPLTLHVTAPGYSGVMRDVMVKADGPAEAIEVELERGGRLSGRITSQGSPVQLGMARIIDPPPGTYIEVASAGRDGRYVLEGVPAGEWTVVFMAGGYPTKQQRVVMKGTETTFDVELDRGVELRGRVVDRRGVGVTGVAVSVRSKGEDAQSGSGRTGVDGWFTIAGLVPSRYRLVTHKPGAVSAAVEIDVPAPEPVTVTIDEGTTIYGRVSGVAGEEMSRLRVVAFGSNTESSAEIDPSGSFVIRGVPEGKVIVTGLLQRGGAERRVNREIVVRPGIPPVEIDFGEGFAIHGRVTIAGMPLRFGTINFNEAHPGSAHAYGRILNGAYEVSVPKAGAYEIRISAEDGFVERSTIKVSAAGTKDIDIRGADVRGRVVDANGAPIPGARVSFVSRSMPSSVRNVRADINGRFVLQALGADPGTMTVRHDGYAVDSRAVVIPPDGGSEMEIRLERGEEVLFVVVDASSGQPVTGSFMEIDKMPAPRGRVTLSRGRHVAVVYAKGYQSQTVEFTVPTSEVRVALVKK